MTINDTKLTLKSPFFYESNKGKIYSFCSFVIENNIYNDRSFYRLRLESESFKKVFICHELRYKVWHKTCKSQVETTTKWNSLVDLNNEKFNFLCC